MVQKDDFETELFEGVTAIASASIDDWRAWPALNGDSATEVWLIIHHASSAARSITYAESIEQCLCFGWVDSKASKRDDQSFYLRFSPRKPASTWSRVNRIRAQSMINQGFMTAAGQAMIDLAKARGTWEVLSDADAEQIPDDLQLLFDRNDLALTHFDAFPPSSRRLILEWIAKAKRPETRQRRIEKTVELAARNIRANHPKAE